MKTNNGNSKLTSIFCLAAKFANIVPKIFLAVFHKFVSKNDKNFVFS